MTKSEIMKVIETREAAIDEARVRRDAIDKEIAEHEVALVAAERDLYQAGYTHSRPRKAKDGEAPRPAKRRKTSAPKAEEKEV